MVTLVERGNLEGVVEACAHRVEYRYFCGDMPPITWLQDEEFQTFLEDEAEQRIRDCIGQDYVSGELNTMYQGQLEIRGWWEIKD